MKEPPVTIVIVDSRTLLKALSTVLALMERQFVIAAEEVQARKIEEN
jgi:hypothetical protein